MQLSKSKKTARILFCSGKIYYELLQALEESGRSDVLIVRVEQLYRNNFV